MQANNSPLRRVRGRVARLVVPGLAFGCCATGSGLVGAAEFANVINVHGFSAANGEGISARGDLVLGTDGNFYGTAYAGGASGLGAIYRLAPDGTLTILHSLAGATTEGSNPYGGLLQAADGNFYGTSYFGGARQVGSVFKVAPDGTYTNLASFDASSRGAYFPYTGLVQASDGNFYGTTLRGGANDAGVVFKMDAAGTVTVIHEFQGGAEGSNPEGQLVVGADAALYGTTLQGGSGGRGTVYKVTTTGTITTLYSFPALGAFNTAGVATNATGANPRAGLTLGSDGNFYGTAYQGGEGGFGTVFRMTPAGAVTVLRAFAGAPTDGANPLAGVTRDTDGSLYGTTERGGTSGAGTAWQITAGAQYRLLHAFTSLTYDGGTPYTKLIPLGGFLYGLTYTDGTLGSGTAFKLDLGSNGVLPVSLTVSPESVAAGAGATLSWSSPTATSCTTAGAWADTVETSGTKALAPTDAGIYTYILTCTDAGGAVRNAHAALVVSAPSAQAVDGGATEGGGAIGVLALTLLGGLAGLSVRNRRHASL
jgi:uncharacterized repeat protein (TIGR03803 family)